MSFSSDALQGLATWLKRRVEILVPALGLPLFFMMLGSNEEQLTTGLMILGGGLAVSYAALILWSPMGLPAKEPRPMDRAELRRTAVMVTLIVVGAIMAQMALRAAFGVASTSQTSSWVSLLTLVLIIVLGTAGIAAERALPIDLFPVVRRREVRRIVYVIVAALFLTVLEQIWTHIFGGLASNIGAALGETMPGERIPSQLDASQPIYLFFYFLIGAGVFEELLFRVGVMTTVWHLSRHWMWGLLASALLFSVYHITLSGFSDYFVQAPVTAVLKSFGAGLATGVIYRYRGFTAAVMTHTLGNWLLVMLIA